MPPAFWNISERIKKNDFPFYCLLAVLSLSVCGGFVFSVTFQSVLFIILITCFAFIFIKKKLKNNNIFIFMSLLLTAIFLSYLGADFQVNVRNVSLGFLNAVIAFFIMLYADNRNKENVLLSLLFLGLWVSFLLFIQIFTGNNIEQSAFLNINIISGFLLVVYTLALGFTEKNKYPVFFLSVSLIIFFAIAVTHSRTAVVLAYAVTVFYFLIIRKNNYFHIFFIAVSCILIAGIVYAFYTKTGLQSLSERFIWWKTALFMFKENALFGVGFGNYGALFLYYRPEPVLNTLFAHNIFLQLLAETGIFGIISFAVVFYIMGKNAVISFKNKNADLIYMKSVVASIIIFLIFNIMEYSFYIPACLTTFFVLCGFLCHCETERRKKSFAFSAVVAAVVLFAIYTVVPFAVAEQYYKNGQRYASKKDYKKAREQYLKAVKYDGKNPEYLHQAADCSFGLYILSSQMEKHYLQDTINFESQSEKLYTHSAQIKSGLANLYRLSADMQNAQKYSEAALKCDKFNPNYEIIH